MSCVPELIQALRTILPVDGVADSASLAPVDPGDWTPGQEPVITSSSGGSTHGSTGTISGGNFSSYRQAPLFFTDFEELAVGADIVASYAGLGGSDPAANSWVVTDTGALAGTKCARMYADQVNMSDMYIDMRLITGWDRDRYFEERFVRINRIDETSSPDAPQIKESRISSGEGHTDQPFFGVTDQLTATITHTNGDGESIIAYPVADRTNDAWERETYHFELSTPGVADGVMTLRTSYNNQWTRFGDNIFSTPNEWADVLRITRDVAASAAQLAVARAPFYQRDQQTTEVLLDHWVASDTPERVILSTSPTRTAATTFDHVACPTISRASGLITYKSLIGCLPAGVAVYGYVANDDGLINATGYLVRAAV